jgi:flagellar biosynthetic protein FliR
VNQLTLNQIVTEIGGGHVPGFFLVLARISPLFVLAPLFSSKMIPARVRGIVAIGLAIGLTGVATHGQRIPTDPLMLAGLMVEELLVGGAFALAIGALLAAIEAAGSIVDSLAGFSFGATVDPINGNHGGVMSEFYGLIGVAMFIAIGGDAWTLRGLARTFDLVPLTRGPRLGPLVAGAEQATVSVLVAALEVAAPALLALLITDVAFGLVTRTVPQLNIFSVGFPLKVGVALLVVAASVPFLGGWMSNQIVDSVSTALHSLA